MSRMPFLTSNEQQWHNWSSRRPGIKALKCTPIWGLAPVCPLSSHTLGDARAPTNRQRMGPKTKMLCNTHPFYSPLSRTTQVSRYQKGKPIWILLKQEIVSGSGISWATCKSARRSRQITMPVPHHSSVLQA